MSVTKYRVNEIFYSVQAEGRNAGRPAVFVRLAGCNLKCPFCDTNHQPYTEMTERQIAKAVRRLDKTGKAMVVITGGEPTLQLQDDQPLLYDTSRFIAMETNGILPAPYWVDWVTISPKTKLTAKQLSRAHEIKVLDGWFDAKELSRLERIGYDIDAKLYIQPTADKRGKFNPAGAVAFAKAHPCWTVSLQWHKLFNIQ